MGEPRQPVTTGPYAAPICLPLIASIAETGDMLDALRRAGNVDTAEGGALP